MPITLQTAQVKPESYKGRLGTQDLAALFQPKADADADRDLQFAQLMGKTDPNLVKKKHRLIRLRTVDDYDPKDIAPCGNGLVHTLEAAYSGHYHLILRPEDIWFAILSQFSLYVNANAEKLRSVFVSHEGKKELEVEAVGDIMSADFGGMAEMMGSLIQKNIIDPDLQEWIVPNFSTTKPEDKVIASIFMMGTLQKYFDYRFTLSCGIPSVTLLGERADWVALRTRVDKLTMYGEEPFLWHALLAPVCDSLVRCFDTDADPTALQDSIDFWSHVCHRQSHGSGSSRLCGWATVFCVWNKDGKWQGSAHAHRLPCRLEQSGGSQRSPSWPHINADAIPRAGAEVDVLVDDNGTKYNTVMVAGLSATKVHQGIESSVSPLAGWAMIQETVKQHYYTSILLSPHTIGRADWVALRTCIDKLTTFGEESTRWHALLAPVCDSFVRCFDADADPAALQDSVDFWSRVCHRKNFGPGLDYLCGWVTVFCVWNKDGRWQARDPKRRGGADHKYQSWPQISADAIPRAGAEVEVLVNDNGTKYNMVMVAGLSATKVHQGVESSVSPLAGWAMYIKP